MNDLRITMIQSNIGWEDKDFNLRSLRARLQELGGATEIVVLPEMFSTGFSMCSEALAEPFDGETMEAVAAMAREFNVALTGTFICRTADGTCRNRAFFVTPDGERHHYDKRHLFRMGSEPDHYSAGDSTTIVSYRGWNIMLQVCYDLRFPAWSRNTGNRYDIIIYMANWPSQRAAVWDTLLRARAIENMAYVCGVNRTGTDGMGLSYSGGSLLISPKGTIIANGGESDAPVTGTISMDSLQAFRAKFPAWMDADTFVID
jgi:predicted amidohydrolase